MDLYLVRHATAVPVGEAAPDDASRELSPKGKRKMRRSSSGLSRLKVKLDEIWTSPLIRARQTADLLAGEFDMAAQVHVEETLSPGSDFEHLLNRLRESQHVQSVALVGHQPDLGRLANWLLTGQQGEAIDFKKGGIAYIQIAEFGPPVRAELRWLLTPGILRKLA